jgi:ABC-type glycerol-3-phosphate transport system substrate-binding protein
MRRILIGASLAALMLSGCATSSSSPQLVAAQTFEASWTGLDQASKAVQAAITSGALKPGSPQALAVSKDLNTATAVLTAADNARLMAGNGSNAVVDVSAATLALADLASILGDK